MSADQAADAQKYYDSVYGANSAKRNQILNDLKTNPVDLAKAQAEYEAAVKDPSTSPAERDAKLKEWQDAYDKWKQNYQDYRALPEEADAWSTGNAAEDAFKAPKPDPAMDPSGKAPLGGEPSGTKPSTEPSGTKPTTGSGTKPTTEPSSGKPPSHGDTELPASHPEPGKAGDPQGPGPLASKDRAALPEDQHAAYDKAWEFYRSQGFADERIEGHLRGIDFSKPIEVMTLPKGTLIQQTQPPGAPQGSYYAPPGTEPGKLGIAPQGDVRGPDGDIVVGHADKGTKIYVTTEDVVVLKSTASKIEDNWSMHEIGTSSRDGTPIPFLAEGGGVQYFTTRKPPIQPYEPPAATTPREPGRTGTGAGDKAEPPPAMPAMAEDPSLHPELIPPGRGGQEFVNDLRAQLDADQQHRLELMTSGKTPDQVREMFGGDVAVARAKLDGSNLPTDLIQQRAGLSPEARRAFDAKWNQMIGGDRAPSPSKVESFKRYLDAMTNRAGGDLEAGLVAENGKLPSDLEVSPPRADDYPKSWDKFDATSNEAFKSKLESFRGNDDLENGYSGGEGTVYPGADRTTALKRWYANRLQDMPASLQKLRDVQAAVQGNPELSAHVEVVKIHETGPDWIIRDWVDDSRPIGESPGGEAARTAAIDALQRKGSLSPIEQDLLGKLQRGSDNLHWSPSRGKIVIIDMQ
jgi:hypothetical protein